MTALNFDVDKLMNQLTTDEKIKLIHADDYYHTEAIERLGIPSLRVSDGPNGVRGTVFFDATPSACFPNGTCLASTFNRELLEECGHLMSIEAEHKGAQAILGPTTNIQRGPLGARGFESFSEDPFLAGISTASIVSGIQRTGRVAATVKHFVCNDLDDERMSSDSIVTERALREIYLEPFRWAVKLANPKCIMTSYNKINGVHCSESPKLIQGVLRDEWKWDGMVMCDWFGTYSTVDAIKCGLDIEFPGPTRFRRGDIVRHLLGSKEKNLSITHINACCRRVLKFIKSAVESRGTTKFNFTQDTLNDTPVTSKTLRKAAAEGIVLLKNQKDVLPLSKKDSIVVIGPNANITFSCSGGGSASMDSYHIVTILQGIENKVGHKITYEPGCYNHRFLCNLFETMTNDHDPSKKGVKASFFNKPAEERSPNEKPFDIKVVHTSCSNLFDYENPAIDQNTGIFYIDFEGYYIPPETGEYKFGCQASGTALMYMDGKLLIDNKTNQKVAPSIKVGSREETAVVHLKVGQKYHLKWEWGSDATSKLSMHWGSGSMQVGVIKVFDEDDQIQRAVNAAKSHDRVILCVGLNGQWETEGMDREIMGIPGRTDELVSAVLRANSNTVVVNQSGTPVEMPWLEDCDTLVHAWYGGNEMGDAIADVLFGDIVPSGKLALSWPYKNEDNPAFLNFHTENGRVLYGEDIFVGYRYYEKLHRAVAFPFGYGLSYTSFEYTNLKVSADEESLKVSLTVRNVGDKYTAKEIVQIYVASLDPSITRPVKELKQFEKVELRPGEAKTVRFHLTLKEACSFFDEFENSWCLEAGKYKLLAGSSSADVRLSADFDVKNTVHYSGL
ncbi:hypothetical protein FOA43_004628 [Brettanomyces nanus]|uniref:beta-glucosidase n=1 Tax=Eeniella nana TaxID=13502 RepID=A0A875S6L0_EENNA|nr:uncharacterized protein FOA43_004628 [Brettanomyces nanus]QPG77221.1 hypothetical protein FOA43_004628 [Brettanomyces nanus]